MDDKQLMREHSRTNLLTARQSLSLLIIVTMVGTSTTFIHVIYPFIQKEQPKILCVILASMSSLRSLTVLLLT